MTESNHTSRPPEAPCPGEQLSVSERIAVGLLSSVQAALFGWAAWALPWQSWTIFSLLSGLLAVLHAATAGAALLRLTVDQTLWKSSSLTGLALLAVVSWQAFTGGAYVASLYGSLGEGLFAAMLAIWGLFVLVTLPTACWALVRTRRAAPRLGKLPWVGGASLCAVVGIGSGAQVPLARARVVAVPMDAAMTIAQLDVEFDSLPQSGKATGATAAPVTRRGPAVCKRPPSSDELTLVATFERRDKPGFRSVCRQGTELPQLVTEVGDEIAQHAAKHPVKLDLIRAVARADRGPAWTHSFDLRPGLDGVCLDRRCFMPWQLLVRGAFLEHRPLDFIGDLKFGTSAREMRRFLLPRNEKNESNGEYGDLLRIETHSWIWSDSGLIELNRLRPKDEPVDTQSISAGASAAQNHIVRAQLKSGKFRYLLHPFSGKKQTKSFSLARQAGTLLVLCELGERTDAVERTIERGLALMKGLERRGNAFSGLAQNAKSEEVTAEDSVLPLVAFTQCRSRVGSRFDATIAGLTRFVQRSQRSNGSFAPALTLKDGAPVAGPEPLFAPGQAILALALVEALQRSAELPALPDPESLEEMRLRAMRHVARDHWPAGVYPYFFVEENWHCLAARASLGLRRDEEYERFCTDYVQFKSRLILDEDSRVDSVFVGGYGFGNVIPPHNTATAGFGEALSAAMAVKHARGEDIEADKRLLTSVLRFLLRQQWSQRNCFGCVPDALGAVSEHTHSPITRIDFVQHTWAALGHGSEALSL